MVGGAEVMLEKLVARMSRNHFQNVVVSLTDAGVLGARIEKGGIPLHCLGMRRGRLGLHGLLKLVGLLRRERPHILQTWMYHADLAGLLCGRLLGIRNVVWNVRCSNMEGCSRLTTWTIKACARLSRRPKAVIVNSEAGQQFHAALGYLPRQWLVIPNGFDLDRFTPDTSARRAVRAELGLGPKAILIGLICRLHAMKGHDTFLRAADTLARDYPNVHFLLAGREVTRDSPDLAPLLVGNSARENVHLLGERRDIPRLMASLDICTSASSYGEGFSNTIGEAMSCGIPCVVTDVGDSATIVGETGLVLPARDFQALAEGWRRILYLGDEGRRQLGQAARQRVERHYNIEVIANRYEQLYSSLQYPPADSKSGGVARIDRTTEWASVTPIQSLFQKPASGGRQP
ncbi:MAG: glycosyltransferase family 4 protein, partial [Gemmataceae bacterium]